MENFDVEAVRHMLRAAGLDLTDPPQYEPRSGGGFNVKVVARLSRVHAGTRVVKFQRGSWRIEKLRKDKPRARPEPIYGDEKDDGTLFRKRGR